MLKPEHSLGASLAVMALDFGIFQTAMPTMADMRATDPHSQALHGANQGATWAAISACAALSLLARDPNIFIFGGGFAVALNFYYRHANAVHPGDQQVTIPAASGAAAAAVS